MSIRAKLSDPKIGGTVAVLCVALAVLIVLNPFAKKELIAGRTAVEGSFYYNPSAKKLEIVPYEGDAKPPEGSFSAWVFSCGDCAAESERIVGYVGTTVEDRIVVSMPDEINWVIEASEEGQAVVNIADRQKCPNGKLKRCKPGRF